jgi:hypothetical protein
MIGEAVNIKMYHVMGGRRIAITVGMMTVMRAGQHTLV